MRTRFPAIPVTPETVGFADEARRIFQELDRELGAEPLTAECSPAVDIYEYDRAVHVVIDLPGVDRSALRVLVKGGSVLIAGVKTVRRPRIESSFHLLERDFGRFARIVRVTRACDMHKARARLVDGELHIAVPKVADRRGQVRAIPVD